MGIEMKLTNRFKAFEQMLEKATKETLKNMGEEMQREAERLVPVDTGDLKKSIGYDIDVKKGELTFFAEETYAEPVEFGTSKQKAQPFLQPAFEKGAATISDKLKGNIKRAGG